MGRKKWNRLTKEGREKILNGITKLQIDLTEIEDNYDKIFDLEEAVNDNIKKLFECDLDCETCSELDRARCMQNFRSANIFYLQKLRTYETIYNDAIKFLIKFLQNMYNILTEGTPLEEEEKDKPIEKGRDPPDGLYG